MKFANVTINSINYGNRLQNYAVNKILKIISYDTENVFFQDYSDTSIKVRIKLLIKNFLPAKIVETLFRNSLNKRIGFEKYIAFKSFTSQQMNNIVFTLYSHPKKLPLLKYDYCFVGSDQVWNPDFAGQDYYFLNFVEPHKRIAFAASIGYTELSNDVLKRYTEHWKQMRYISVREDSAADIIEQATGKRPDVFLDPTLLLTREEWDELAKQPKCNLPKKYILCLFLGKMPEYIKEAYKKAYNMELVILNDQAFPDYYVQGPSEFVWLVQNAELVLTDSFHCSVFSIIYHKQFWVFERDDIELKNMFTRMETLLKRFDMMDRIQKRNVPVSSEKISEQRFIEAEDIRSGERDRVLQIIGDIVKS